MQADVHQSQSQTSQLPPSPEYISYESIQTSPPAISTWFSWDKPLAHQREQKGGVGKDAHEDLIVFCHCHSPFTNIMP